MKISPRTKRRYNLVFKARKKGYIVFTGERMIHLPANADERNPTIENKLADFGFHVQLKIV
jgi:hypothetical protein